MPVKCNAVFEGGGVKGIALCGAVSVLESAGYEFENYAGTSAGAIVASLLAAGYCAGEIREQLMGLDFKKFRQEDFISRLGVAGKAVKILLKYGIYSSGYFETWLTELLAKKRKFRFSDIVKEGWTDERYKYKFQAVASDLTDKKILVLPGDLSQFGLDPDGFSIAKAVRMSMSIPFYYEPYILTDIDGREHIIVDGGLLSNYPLWILDDEKNVVPTIGMKLSLDAGQDRFRKSEIGNIVEYSKSLVSTAMDAHDSYYVSTKTGDKQRTMFISTTVSDGKNLKNISATDFDLTQEESEQLYQNGIEAAEEFIGKWSFEAWKKGYRNIR